MAMRLQELHPSLVHFPIAALPTVVTTDLIGLVTRSRSLERFGRLGLLATAAGAALAATSGLIAQEEVEADGPALDTLITHRNLNAGVLLLTSYLAVRRLVERRITLGGLLAATAGVAGVLYTAYLGGKLVYEYGAGVEAANGVKPGAPELTPETAPAVRQTATQDLGQGVKTMVSEVMHGKLAPTLFPSQRASNGNGRSSRAMPPAGSPAD